MTLSFERREFEHSGRQAPLHLSKRVQAQHNTRERRSNLRVARHDIRTDASRPCHVLALLRSFALAQFLKTKLVLEILTVDEKQQVGVVAAQWELDRVSFRRPEANDSFT